MSAARIQARIRRTCEGSLRHAGSLRSMGVLLGAGLLLAGLGGCHGLIPPRDLQPPQLAVSDVRLDGLHRGQARIALTLEAHNPNALELPLSEVQFEMRLFGRSVGHGAIEHTRFVLPAQSSRPLPVALTVSGPDLARALASGLFARRGEQGTDTPDWQVQGMLRWGQNPLPLAFSRSGRLSEARP
jgi:hypothetical protein